MYSSEQPQILVCRNREGTVRPTSWEQWTRREDEIGYPDGFVFRPSDSKVIFMTGTMLQAPGARLISPGARVSQHGGRSWEILRNGLPDRLQAGVEAFSLRGGGGFSGENVRRRSSAARISANTGTKSSAAWPRSGEAHIGIWWPRSSKHDLTTKDLAVEPQSNRSDSRKGPSLSFPRFGNSRNVEVPPERTNRFCPGKCHEHGHHEPASPYPSSFFN